MKHYHDSTIYLTLIEIKNIRTAFGMKTVLDWYVVYLLMPFVKPLVFGSLHFFTLPTTKLCNWFTIESFKLILYKDCIQSQYDIVYVISSLETTADLNKSCPWSPSPAALLKAKLQGPDFSWALLSRITCVAMVSGECCHSLSLRGRTFISFSATKFALLRLLLLL